MSDQLPQSMAAKLEFFRVADLIPQPGTFHDLFGVRTRVEYLPEFYNRYSGAVAGFEDQQQLPMHDHIEMSGMLDAALGATEKFTVMELGAGWGPWVVMGAAMARKRGLEYRLIAIEGSSDHFDFMKTHFLDNGLNPADHKILRGVVAAEDGIAKFPKIANPSSDYGASIGVGAVLEDVKAYSVATLLRGEPVIDILHCDVQGNEVDVLAPALVDLRKQVRRIVIGTHGRKIEESLFDLFGSAGWRLDGDAACQMKQANGSIVLVQDGAQLWVNPDDV